MIKAKRINEIIELLEEEGSVNVRELSDRFGVTMMTIRRDLEEIESRDYIERTHGGAIYHVSAEKTHEVPSLNRMNLFINEKVSIAKKAASMISDGETIFIGSGSTTLCLAKEIRDRADLSVVTNSVLILNELATDSRINLIMVGGFLRRAEFSLIGHFASDMIDNLHVDKVFIGMVGIHAKFGLTSNHPEEILTDRKILKMSDNVIILADHTKIGHVAASRTSQISAAKTIITGKSASREMVDAILQNDVDVILV
jgi:DeoR/GlpR family transcriptional regulator of sugar metabolism